MTAHTAPETTRDYLARRFVGAERLGAAAGVSGAEVEALVADGLLPQPSYVVADGRLISVAFGPLDGQGLIDGAYFHTGMAVWLDEALAAKGRDEPVSALRARFIAAADQARAELEREGWPAPECMGADGRSDPAKVSQWLEDLWRFHMAGIFGVCVRRPDAVDQIVLKEVMQAVLSARTDNGARADFSTDEAVILRALTDRYAEACSDFAPVEYPLSSRKRYLEGLRSAMPR
jgi:hypothetical protein